MTSTVHLLHGKWTGKQSGIGIGIGNGIKVGRIQVKFDNVPFVNVANKFDGGEGSDDVIGSGSGASGGGGGGGAKNGYWKRLISIGDGQGIVDGKRTEGCHVRLIGGIGVWSTRRIFPFEGEDDDEDDRWRFDDDKGESFRWIPFVFVFVIVGVERRIGNINFRLFVSINCCSRLSVPCFFSED